MNKLNSAIRTVLQQQARLEAMGNAVRIETPEQFRETVRAHRQKWADVVKAAGITIE